MPSRVFQYGSAKSRCDPLANTKAASSSCRGRSGSHSVTNLFTSSGTMFASECQCVSPNPGGFTNTQLWYTRTLSSSSAPSSSAATFAKRRERMYFAHGGSAFVSVAEPGVPSDPGGNAALRLCRLNVCRNPTSSSECFLSTSSASASFCTRAGSWSGHNTAILWRYASSCRALVSRMSSETMPLASSLERTPRTQTCPLRSNASCSWRVTSRSPLAGNTSEPWLESSNTSGGRGLGGAEAFARLM
mmetsp:Transcript_14949/g.63096  ORF Transcript_14949/g.63096 Transcript_14949/m.63096 type:complete len:246 (-) Transcript_14949:144-881(-)